MKAGIRFCYSPLNELQGQLRFLRVSLIHLPEGFLLIWLLMIGMAWTLDPSDASSFYFLGALAESGFPQGWLGITVCYQTEDNVLLQIWWHVAGISITHCNFRGLLNSFQKSGCSFFKWIWERFVRRGIFKMTTQISLILILKLIEYQLVGKPSAGFLAFWFPFKQWLARFYSAHQTHSQF